VKGNQKVGAAGRDLGLVEQALRIRCKAVKAGKLKSRGGKVIGAERI